MIEYHYFAERSWESNIAEQFCSKLLLIAPITEGLQSIPDVYGQGHLLIENRPAIIRIFKVSSLWLSYRVKNRYWNQKVDSKLRPNNKAIEFLLQFQILRKAHEKLTFFDEHGNDDVLIGETDHYNLGVVS